MFREINSLIVDCTYWMISPEGKIFSKYYEKGTEFSYLVKIRFQYKPNHVVFNLFKL